MAEETLRDGWLAGEPPADPLPRLRAWIDEARSGGQVAEPDAATLATVDPNGRPSARVVLLRGLDLEHGAALFYTNRESRKGRALAATPFASLVLYWDRLARQARLEGPVTLASDAESDAYYAARPRGHRLSAWASDQSRPIASREALEARFAQVVARFPPGEEVPRPPDWGGYRLVARSVELWAGRPDRLHDRVRCTRGADGTWHSQRLMP